MNCTRVYVMGGPHGGFWLYFYGLTVNDLTTVPNPYIASAIKRRGIGMDQGYNSSPFLVESVRPRQRNYVMESMIGKYPT